MRVYLGSDHAGFELKSAVAEAVAAAGHDVADCGPPSYQPGDDYPPYVMRAAAAAAANPGSIAIVIGGSGNGEQIASNKIDGIRAALAWNEETARLARQHNDANVLSLGARMHPVPDAVRFALVFLADAVLRRTAPPAADRHDQRLRGVRHPAAATGRGTARLTGQRPWDRRRRTRLRPDRPRGPAPWLLARPAGGGLGRPAGLARPC